MKPTRPKTPKTPMRQKGTFVDPVEVYCRLRPPEDENDEVCIKSTGDCTITLMPREGTSSVKNGFVKEMHYTFKFIFDENVSQKELFYHVAFPLIGDLIHGKNGLLFTYGVTSSGKTYTMTGTPNNAGLLPRCLDTLFNSIGNYQTQQYVFKPDKLNGFDIQSTAEAMLDMQKELGIMTPKVQKQKRKDGEIEWSSRTSEDRKVDDVDPDKRYAVFISYVEIYNNYIYDLLEDSPIDLIKPKPPQSKILREDGAHNMYVFGVSETEAKNVHDAFDLFHKGQKRRRVAHTSLNTESSRSHSVFNIRLVQAPLDPMGADVLQDKNQITVSQLSLVDLAGSERTVRTRNTGDRLREAGNINTSLMALRECIEVLRENQNQPLNKFVPYRKSKLTHLFKNFFEGKGKVRMVVCVNPRVDDYEEIVHVMRFSEMAQEVLIPRTISIPDTPMYADLKPGRGNIYRDAVCRAEEEGVPLEDVLSPTIYSLGPPFPMIESIEDEACLAGLVKFLNERKIRRETLQKDLRSKQNNFRRQIEEGEKEVMTLKHQVKVFQMDLEAREQQVKCLERELSNAKEENDALNQKLGESERDRNILVSELDEKDFLLNHENREKEKIRAELKNRYDEEKAKMKRIMEKRLQMKQHELEAKICCDKEKLRQLREILNADDCWEDFVDAAYVPTASGATTSVVPTPALSLSSSEPKRYHLRSGTGTDVNVNFPSTSPAVLTSSVSDTRLHDITNTPLSSRAVANPRHRRSSSQGDVWLAHQPVGNLQLDTIFQPKMKKKKSCSKLNVKDVTKEVSKYALVHQEQDRNGEVETQLYKGDVVPSCSGGAQVIFNDVETLRQTSPTSYNLRKRSASKTPTQIDVEDRCRVAIEGKPPTVAKKPRH